MTTFLHGLRSYGLTRDDENYKDYTVKYIVGSTDPQFDTPEAVLNTPGLPLTGSIYSIGNDTNNKAFCRPETTVSIHQEKEGDSHPWWLVEKKFSTRPLKNCTQENFDDPLLEPQKVSGSFVKFTEEAITDKDGNLLVSSSFEQFRGSKVEFDANRPTVKIEQNVANLELALLASLVNRVNDDYMWGLPARCVKLSNVRWERKVQGTCDYYYTRSFDFDINFKTFDRPILDEGTKVLNGHWSRANVWIVDNIDGSPPDPTNPTHFKRFKDTNGENSRALLDGAGKPLTVGSAPYYFIVRKYLETNLFITGVPNTF